MKQRKRLRSLFLCLALTVQILGGCGAGNQMTKFEAQYFDLFDTVTTFTIYTDREETFRRLSKKLYLRLKEYHQWFQIYEDFEGIANIKTINDHAGKSPVAVDSEILDLLRFGISMYEETEGAVNIAMGSVLSLWRQYREDALADKTKADVPVKGELEKASEHMRIADLVIDDEASTVYLRDSEMSLDVGAIAKGYAAERLAEYAKELGIESALLNLGGNIRTIGRKPDGSDFHIGVQNPDGGSDPAYVYESVLNDGSMVTSGDYQRYYEVDGVRYHHIINPKTLFPEHYYRSVTILTEDAALADAYSTALFQLPLERAKELIQLHPRLEAVFVMPDGEVVAVKESEGTER